MSKKTIIIIVAVLALAIIIGVVAGVMFWKNSNSEPKEVVKYNLTVDDMYCNIKESKRILKLKMTVESIDPDSIERLSEKVFLIRDEVNKIARGKTYEELEGSEGQIKLQERIKNNLIELFPNESISNVYFNDFIIQ